ncbi:fibulin-1-like isoform X2 [Polypterus senegalus]|uniref:fibulin-1-like isoform X2 n=1 Tax=Polypterus senegalus TaxID=55291 RepID=UPI001966CD5B|nr:fibulin-1-like isoform X2 [Polypterus senegalus]
MIPASCFSIGPLERKKHCEAMTIPFLVISCLMIITQVNGSPAPASCAQVHCPPMPSNCIEAGIRSLTGSSSADATCCPVCLTRGCKCQGYQLWDCIAGGYPSGKVPAGASYLVDSGSTECRCPSRTGGHIICHFLPCPELPPNCLEVWKPQRSSGQGGSESECPQCLRTGCLNNGRQVDEGHTDFVDSCTLCHCQAGGTLVCAPKPDCKEEAGTSHTKQLVDLGRRQLTRPDDEQVSSRSTVVPPQGKTPISSSFQTQMTRVKTSNLNQQVPPQESGSSSTRKTIGRRPQAVGPKWQSSRNRAFPGVTHAFIDHLTVIDKGPPFKNPLSSTSDHLVKGSFATISGVVFNGHRTGDTTVRPSSSTLGLQQTQSPSKFKQEKNPIWRPTASQPISYLSVDSCCAKGRRIAMESKKCNVTRGPSQETDHCRIIRVACCVSTKEDLACQMGIKNAQQGSSTCLWDLMVDDSADMARMCYECCSLGLQAQALALSCTLISSMSPAMSCASAFEACCLPDAGGRREPRRPQEESQGRGELHDGLEARTYSLCQGPLNPCSQLCTEKDQSVLCSCHQGYRLKSDLRSCEDINECIIGLHNCTRFQTCENTPGAFLCTPNPEACQEGYSFNNGQCADLDECILGTHSCNVDQLCENTAGSFSCRQLANCAAGYQAIPLGGCSDVNECSALVSPCTEGYNCINTIGSYACHRHIVSCGRGYHASEDGMRCVDVDECRSGVHRCSNGQICINAPGTYRCDCSRGYKADPVTRRCVDIDECTQYSGRVCAQKCRNEPGSYNCDCEPGYTLTKNQRNCQDVNECESAPCSQECANVYGSFYCYCQKGFVLNQTDRSTCEDIDECAMDSTLCSFHCVNTPGSFHCACPKSGYTLSSNGRNCKDVDECTLGTHNCSLTESCFNIQGDFRCLSIQCPQGYRRTEEFRCERESCLGFSECQSTPQHISYHRLTFPSSIRTPADIFRIAHSPPIFAGDHVLVNILSGNEEGLFSARRSDLYTGLISLLAPPPSPPQDFHLHVEMTLLRHRTATKFHAVLYVFITPPST